MVQAAVEVMGEVGRVTGLTDQPRTVQLSRGYANPVVFALLPSANGSDPAAVRVSDVRGDGFTLRLQEPGYLDGGHAGEAVSYLVLEAGLWRLGDGALLEVGELDTGALAGQGHWEVVAFEQDFATAPAVFSQVQTLNGPDFVRTRHQGVGPDGFRLALEEAEASDGFHAGETVGYLALTPGTGEWGGLAYQAGTTGAAVTDAWHGIDFAPGLDGGGVPHLLAALASYNGADPAGLRYSGLDGDGVEVRVEEERSADSETAHVAEQVAFLALDGAGGQLAAQPVPHDYAEFVQALAPVVYWRFGEPAGNTAMDSAVGGADAVYRGGVALGAPGLVPGGDTAARFDGVNDRVAFDPAADGEVVDILVLGDSLTDSEFFGIKPADAFPANLGAALVERGYAVDVIDFSVGGDTTAEGLARLEALLADDGAPLPDAAIVELGTNDALLRLRPVGQAEDNLRDILQLFDDNDVEVLLTGAAAFYEDYNGGRGYARPADRTEFEAIYPRLAEEFGIDLYPFFLDGVLDDPVRLTSDGLHANARGVDVIVERILPQAMDLVEATGLVDDPLRLAEGTVALWFQPDDLVGRQALFSKGLDGGTAGIGLLALNGGDVHLLLQDGSQLHELVASGPNAVRAGAPNHVAFSFGPGGAELYVNGALADREAGATVGLDGNAEPTILGAQDSRTRPGDADRLGNFFDGVVDEVAVFDRALGAETVRGLYEAGAGGPGLDTLVVADDGTGPAVA